ncbi:Uncharacterised protein [Edwardsiella tarda]|nr:Uncharacterised protein [Edwardsiella tarda]
MRHQPVEILAGQLIRLQGFIDDVSQLGHRHLKDLVASHGQVSLILGMTRAIRQGQQLAIAAIGMNVRREDPRLLGGAENHGTRPITKQDHRATILRIDGTRQRIGANHQGMANRAPL